MICIFLFALLLALCPQRHLGIGEKAKSLILDRSGFESWFCHIYCLEKFTCLSLSFLSGMMIIIPYGFYGD